MDDHDDPAALLCDLAKRVSQRVPRQITRDEMLSLVKVVERLVSERPDYIDMMDVELRRAFFAFRAAVLRPLAEWTSDRVH